MPKSKINTRKKNTDDFLSLRASVAPGSYNKENNTIDVVFATDTPVLRFDWSEQEHYNEILTFGKDNVRLDRINSGGPVLNSHSCYELSDILGIVVKAWVENGKGYATLKFSERDEVAGLIKDIIGGIIKNVSVGYRVHKYEKTEAEEGTIAEKRATDWEPFEISMVPIPADPNSTTRNLPTNKNLKTRNMAKKELIPDEKEAKKKAFREKRALELQNASKEAKEAERKRVSLITTAFRKAGLEKTEMLDSFVADGITVSKARKLIIDEMSKDDKGTRSSNVTLTGQDEQEQHARSVQDAILLRVNPKLYAGKEDKISEATHSMRGLTMLDLAREALERNGVKTRGMSKREIAVQALMGNTRGAQSISDFPTILGNTINRTLRAEYELAPRTFMDFCRQVSAADFRPMTRTQLGDVSDFSKIKEGGEYKRGKVGEAKESYSVEKYGEIIPFTWEALINDDLSAFNRIPKSIAQTAAQKQSDIVWGIFIDNAVMADNVALFHATHKNLMTSAAIGIDSLAEGRKLLRKQTTIGGRFMDLEAKYLIVAPEKEELADQYTSQNFVPINNATINNKKNSNLQPIVEPRLSALNSGLSWFLAADPGRVDTIEYAFLEGDGELFTEQRVGFDVDGLEIKARMVFGAKAIDWRGLQKNAGA